MVAMRDIEQNMSHTDDLIAQRKTSQKKKSTGKPDRVSEADEPKPEAKDTPDTEAKS
jgi:hypothetical protein